MNMTLRRQTLCRRRELNVVGTTRHDAISRLQPASNADEVAVPRHHVNETPVELLAADLHEDIRPAGLHQERLTRHDRDALFAARVEHGCSGLADQEASSRILDLNLERQRARLLV